MIEVRTLLRTPAGDFVPMADADDPPEDPRYVEGALELTVRGRPLLTTEHWDYVDQLWAYLGDGLVALSRGRSWETYFPDQPLRLRFEPAEGGRSVRVELASEETRDVVIPAGVFIRTMAGAGSRFWNELARLLPGRVPGTEEQRRRLESLREGIVGRNG